MTPNNTVLLTDGNGDVFAVRGTDGVLKWNVSIPGVKRSGAPSVDSKGAVLICTDDGLFALDGKDGSVKWQQETACRSSSQRAAVGHYGTIFVESKRPSIDWIVAEAKFLA